MFDLFVMTAAVSHVMAGPDPATSRDTVREQMAGSSLAMTMGQRLPSPEMPEFVTVGMHP